MNAIIQNRVSEWSFVSGKSYSDPFNDVELDVVFTDQDGAEQVVPGFWAGDGVWRVRFSSSVSGRFHYRTVCSDVG